MIFRLTDFLVSFGASVDGIVVAKVVVVAGRGEVRGAIVLRLLRTTRVVFFRGWNGAGRSTWRIYV